MPGRTIQAMRRVGTSDPVFTLDEKEKVLTAPRAGPRTVILPRRNEPDLDDVPPELRPELGFILVEEAHEVLAQALQSVPTARAA